MIHGYSSSKNVALIISFSNCPDKGYEEGKQFIFEMLSRNDARGSLSKTPPTPGRRCRSIPSPAHHTILSQPYPGSKDLVRWFGIDSAMTFA